MKYLDYIYIGSFDPMTRNHQFVWQRANKELKKKIDIIICKNDLKDGGMFNLNERKAIIENYYNHYGQIYLAKTKSEILLFIQNAKIIVRGMRSMKYNDHETNIHIANYYTKLFLQKLHYIKTTDKNIECSSSLVKRMIRENKKSVAEKYIPKEVAELINDRI